MFKDLQAAGVQTCHSYPQTDTAREPLGCIRHTSDKELCQKEKPWDLSQYNEQTTAWRLGVLFPAQAKNFSLLPRSDWLWVGSIFPPVLWASGIFPQYEKPESEKLTTLLCSIQFKNAWSYTLISSFVLTQTSSHFAMSHQSSYTKQGYF